MAQARRKKQARINPKRGTGANSIGQVFTALKQGLGMFTLGAVAGVIALLFWQGYHSENPADLGSGLQQMIQQSRLQAEKRAAEVIPPEPILVDKAPRVKPQYDFYTVLPEIEEVLPKEDVEPTSPAVVITSIPDNAAKAEVKPPASTPLKAGNAYMLQVASYGQQSDAERLKAKLALGGLRAIIQKVSIERKNYDRVRVGPYTDYGSMTSDDYKLTQMGFKAMRLRLSKAG